jgi:hypothetical protein
MKNGYKIIYILFFNWVYLWPAKTDKFPSMGTSFIRRKNNYAKKFGDVVLLFIFNYKIIRLTPSKVCRAENEELHICAS